jgi:chemotaxis protein MotB
MANKDDNVIIKKVKKVQGHGHHGGAWKIAYADFVTAMMAFFLLMWLLNATSEEQKMGIANYFDPLSVGSRNGGSRGVMGGTSLQSKYATLDSESSSTSIKPTNLKEKGVGGDGTSEGKEVNAYNAYKDEDTKNVNIKGEHNNKEIKENKKKEMAYVGFLRVPKPEKISDKVKKAKRNYQKIINENVEKIKKEMAKRNLENIMKQAKIIESQEFKEVKTMILETIKNTPNLKELLPNMVIEITEKGLKIQLIDQKNRPLFLSGSKEPMEYTHRLFSAVAQTIKKVENDISISGHTDSTPYSSNDYTNWELSSDRALKSRKILEEKGISSSRIYEIVGSSDKDPFKAKDPFDPQNRRICITLLRKYK